MFRRMRRRAQSTAEYILIVVLVAVLSIGIITVFGNQIRDLFRVSTERMGGEEDSRLRQEVTDRAAGEADKSLEDIKE
ncbi:MAG: Flp family type IVb pilin [Candidatus Brocadiia bacterium]